MSQFSDKSYLLSLPLQKIRCPFRRLVSPKPVHVMFLYVDHFEPWEDTRDPEIAEERMANWLTNYPQMASNHQDADGGPPKHTWFYLLEDWRLKEYDTKFLWQLSGLCYDNFGEIELHVHHGLPESHIFSHINNSEKLKFHIEELKSLYSRFGALISAEEKPKLAFGFIHGKWALDNAMNGEYCGVNDELSILNQTGCYADFTMPSGIRSQARKINSIYYAKDNPERSKSYNSGRAMRKGGKAWGDLLIFPGPVDVYWQNLFNNQSTIEKANLDVKDLPFEYRIRRWIASGIHVINRPEWVFVKMHTHGTRAENAGVNFGSWADKMFSYLESHFNDGTNYRLHYVTAREAYNIAKAAEADYRGDPDDYRNYLINSYANTKIKCNCAYRLDEYTPYNYHLSILETVNDVDIEMKDFALRQIRGKNIEKIAFEEDKQQEKRITTLMRGNENSMDLRLTGDLDEKQIQIDKGRLVRLIKHDNSTQITLSPENANTVQLTVHACANELLTLT